MSTHGDEMEILIMSKLLRVRCTSCDYVMDTPPVEAKCPKCDADIPLFRDACVQIYRKKSFWGFPLPIKIYIDNIPYKSLWAGQSIRIPLRYGQHSIQFGGFLLKRSAPTRINFTTKSRNLYTKIGVNFGFVNKCYSEFCYYDEMPPLEKAKK